MLACESFYTATEHKEMFKILKNTRTKEMLCLAVVSVAALVSSTATLFCIFYQHLILLFLIQTSAFVFFYFFLTYVTCSPKTLSVYDKHLVHFI